jgi:hypothetical protein
MEDKNPDENCCREGLACCQPSNFCDLFPLGEFISSFMYLCGIHMLIRALQVFSFFTLNKSLNKLTMTLWVAKYDMAVFMFAVVIVVGGLAFWANLSYGGRIERFHTFNESFISLLRMVLGDFDFDEMVRNHNGNTALFFFTFLLTVWLVLLNLIIALLSGAFDDVNYILRNKQQWKKTTEPLGTQIRRYSKYNLRRAIRLICPSIRRLPCFNHTEVALIMKLQYTKQEIKVFEAFKNIMNAALRKKVRKQPINASIHTTYKWYRLLNMLTPLNNLLTPHLNNPKNPEDLYDFFEAHYEDTKDIQGLSNSNTFISLEHLCSMVRDVSVERATDCTHTACITRTFIAEYRKHKQVEVFQHGTAGQSLRAATRDDEITRVRRFLVKKRNRQGQAQLRYVSVIDVYGLLGVGRPGYQTDRCLLVFSSSCLLVFLFFLFSQGHRSHIYTEI